MPGGAFSFQVAARDPASRARTGRLVVPHGEAPTPVFMPVGTLATVKSLTPDQIAETGSTVILCNTFHLHERPGEDVIEALGGLHAFMGYPGPILTDSGGYQVFSLASLREIDDDGVSFRSPLDGSPRRLTPETALDIQRKLGADVVMAFDECIPADRDRAYVEEACRRTIAWERRSAARHPGGGRGLFGIGQGGTHGDLRRSCLLALLEMPFDGMALGGLLVGEETGRTLEMIEVSTEVIPESWPRYLMGVGSPVDLLRAVERGVDMFDCVLPTRNARNGQALTFDGPLRLRNARHARDAAPLEAECPCLACRRFSRAYLRHLAVSGEMLSATLLTLHNLTFLARLMAGARDAIANRGFGAFRRNFEERYQGARGGASQA